MTQAEFKELPLLLRRRDAMEVLGCNKTTLAILRDSHRDLAVRLSKVGQYRYRKIVVARIAGLKYD
jgi:hypothetical protein